MLRIAVAVLLILAHAAAVGAQTPYYPDRFDWRRREDEEWTIAVETSDGTSVRLENGGARLLLNGEAQTDDGIGEYPDIYRTFVDLIDERRSLVDVAPFRLVADCLLVGRTRSVDAFNC